MASTRNINTPGNYCQQQNTFRHSEMYTLYPNSQYGAAYKTELPGNGLLAGQFPGNTLSNNAIDTESFLYGINSTNLVNPAPCFTPQIKKLCSANIYETPITYIPEPLIIDNERPFPVPN